jgi:hypothetical protein
MDPMPSRAARTASLVITVLLSVTVVVGAALVAHSLFGLFQDSGALSVPTSTRVDDVQLPDGFEIAGPLPVTADVVHPSLLQRVIATVPVFVWWALALAGLWLLRGVVRSAAQGDPFRVANVRRLRWLFLFGFPLAVAVGGYFNGLLFDPEIWTGGPLPPGGIDTSFPVVVSAPAILAAVSLFALAEVFAYGARLREDVDATI